MAAGVLSVLLLLGLSAGTGPSSPGSHPDSERGMLELQRVRSLAAQPRYGECWARALEHLDTRCRDMTSESQSRIALQFAHCHLSSSGRDFPSCSEGSEVSRCTGGMDAVAFNAYTEFFTHTHSICHFLQSEAWQRRAETIMYRLTDTSAGVVEQLQSTREMAEDLMEAQSAALQVQQEILTNGEELRTTLRDSTQGLRSLFSELSSVSQQQQVALSELFNRVSILQSFLLMEAHSLSSCCYNAAALCCAFLLTCTQRTCRARLPLLSLVCLNFYLEKKIYQSVMNQPEHQHLELLSVYLGILRRFMLAVAAAVLLVAYVRYTDPLQESLRLLQQLQETQSSLQEALQRAESLCQEQKSEDRRLQVKKSKLHRTVEERREEEEEEEKESPPTDSSHLSHLSHSGSSVVQSRTLKSSPLVYSVLVEELRKNLQLSDLNSCKHLEGHKYENIRVRTPHINGPEHLRPEGEAVKCAELLCGDHLDDVQHLKRWSPLLDIIWMGGGAPCWTDGDHLREKKPCFPSASSFSLKKAARENEKQMEEEEEFWIRCLQEEESRLQQLHTKRRRTQQDPAGPSRT